MSLYGTFPDSRCSCDDLKGWIFLTAGSFTGKLPSFTALKSVLGNIEVEIRSNPDKQILYSMQVLTKDLLLEAEKRDGPLVKIQALIESLLDERRPLYAKIDALDHSNPSHVKTIERIKNEILPLTLKIKSLKEDMMAEERRVRLIDGC